MISNCGHDENGKFKNGKAGDQTGKEWEIRPWYNGKWSCVIRHSDAMVRNTIADLAEKSANNPHIGYDQNNRLSYWNELERWFFQPEKINTNCESDCSAGVSAIVKATGYLLELDKLKCVSAINTTKTLKNALKKAGFTILTGKEFTGTANNLMRGDILLRENHHVAINLTEEIDGGEDVRITTIKEGSRGKAVQVWQIIVGAKTDGIFGNNTRLLTMAYQKKHGLEVDGIVGEKTWKYALENL